MAYDGRSKIDQHGYDTKSRIKSFLSDINNEFSDEKRDTKEIVKQKTYR